MATRSIPYEKFRSTLKNIVRSMKFIFFIYLVGVLTALFRHISVEKTIISMAHLFIYETIVYLLLYSSFILAVVIGYFYLEKIIKFKLMRVFLKWIILDVMIVMIYDVFEQLGFIPDKTFWATLNDFILPVLFIFTAWTISWGILYISAERIKIESIFEKVFQLFGVLLMIIPVVIFISIVWMHGISVRYDPLFIIGDVASSVIGIVFGIYYFTKMYLYTMRISYLDITDIFSFFVSGYVMLNLADALENFVPAKYGMLMLYIKAVAIPVIGFSLIILFAAAATLFNIIDHVEMIRREYGGETTSLLHWLVKVSFDKPVMAYLNLIDFLDAMTRFLRLEPHKISLCIIMKPTSILPSLLDNHPRFKESKKYIAVVAPGLGYRLVSSREHEYYSIEPSALRITYFIKRLTERSDVSKPLIIVFDTLTDYIYLTDIKEVYITLRNITSLSRDIIGLYIIVSGAHEKREIELLKNVGLKEAQL